MNISILFEWVFGTLKRIVQLNDHETRIKNIESKIIIIEATSKESKSYIDDLKKEKKIFMSIEIDNATNAIRHTLSAFYENIDEDIKLVDYEADDVKIAQAITDKYISNFHSNAETLFFSKGVSPELYKYIERSLSKPVEEIKKKYHQKYLDLFVEFRGEERIERISRELKFFSRELTSTVTNNFLERLRNNGKIH